MSARPGMIRFKLPDEQVETLERLIARHSISGLAEKWGVSIYAIDRLRFGGTSLEETVDKIAAFIAEAA